MYLYPFYSIYYHQCLTNSLQENHCLSIPVMIICDDLVLTVVFLYLEQTRSLLPSIHLMRSPVRDRDSRTVGILYDAHLLCN